MIREPGLEGLVLREGGHDRKKALQLDRVLEITRSVHQTLNFGWEKFRKRGSGSIMEAID